MYVYVSIDTYRCNGCGSCVELCPESFRLNETGDRAEVADGCVPLRPELEEAQVMCPLQCIELEEC